MNQDGCVLWVKVIPSAHRDELVSLETESLKIRLRASPMKGEANEALIRFLANSLKIGVSRIILRKGKTSRLKEVLIQGLSWEEVECRFLGNSQNAKVPKKEPNSLFRKEGEAL